MSEAAELTRYIGTDQYMSPEQCAPQRVGRPGVESDVWGLGATLFEAVAGYRPFDDGDPEADDPRARFPQLVEPPYELPERVPAEVAKVVYGALEAEPADRPLPHEIATALEPVLAAQPFRRTRPQEKVLVFGRRRNSGSPLEQLARAGRELREGQP
jgi:serine/threonine-protein kinase